MKTKAERISFYQESNLNRVIAPFEKSLYNKSSSQRKKDQELAKKRIQHSINIYFKEES